MPLPMDVKAVKEVLKYRSKGLSFREIARLLEVDVRQVHRWYKYAVDSYPHKAVDNKR